MIIFKVLVPVLQSEVSTMFSASGSGSGSPERFVVSQSQFSRFRREQSRTKESLMIVCWDG